MLFTLTFDIISGFCISFPDINQSQLTLLSMDTSYVYKRPYRSRNIILDFQNIESRFLIYSQSCVKRIRKVTVVCSAGSLL